MSRQFVKCAFSEGGRPYTYHNDGEPVAVDDVVLVPVRGDARQCARVVEITDEAPHFDTKAIVGRSHQITEESR